MSAIFSYNGVEFGFAHSPNGFSQSVNYDQSGVDQVSTTYRFDVNTIVWVGKANRHNNMSPQVFDKAVKSTTTIGNLSPEDGETIAAFAARLARRLKVPRRHLSYKCGGLHIESFDGIDEGNGPRPLSVRVSNLTEQSLLISFSVEATLRDAPEAAAIDGQLPYSSLRWTSSENVDYKGYSSISHSGVLIARRSVLKSESIDDYRHLIFPPLRDKHIRTGHFSLAPDGLRVSFSLNDREAEVETPPYGFATFELDDSRSIERMGSTYYAQIDCSGDMTKEAARDPAQRKLCIEQMLKIASDALKASNPIQSKNGSTIISGGAIREKKTGTRLSCMLRAQVQAPTVVQKVKESVASSIGDFLWSKTVPGALELGYNLLFGESETKEPPKQTQNVMRMPAGMGEVPNWPTMRSLDLTDFAKLRFLTQAMQDVTMSKKLGDLEAALAIQKAKAKEEIGMQDVLVELSAGDFGGGAGGDF